MRVYTVHEPAAPLADRVDRAEELRFIKDGFSWGAAIFAPLWMILRGLWLAFLLYVLAMIVLGFGIMAFGIGDRIATLLFVAIHILIGFEGDTIERWTLGRRGWRMIGSVTGRDAIECERRFFDSWLLEQPMFRPETFSSSHMVGTGDASSHIRGAPRQTRGWRSMFPSRR